MLLIASKSSSRLCLCHTSIARACGKGPAAIGLNGVESGVQAAEVMPWNRQRGSRPTPFSQPINLSHGWWSTVLLCSICINRCTVPFDKHGLDKLPVHRLAQGMPKDGSFLQFLKFISSCPGVPLEDDYQNLQKYICVAIRDIPK